MPLLDLIVVGGGPVGSAAALAAARAGFECLLLEAREPAAPLADPRAIALSYASQVLLEELGAWGEAIAATPIVSVHVSQRGAPGRTLLAASDLRLPALGAVVAYGALEQALAAAAAAAQGVTCLSGAPVTATDAGADAVAVEYQHAGARQRVAARLVVIADGGRSLAAGGGQQARDYHHTALVAAVRTDLPPQGRAYERFTPDGPVALLPWGERFALVWTVAPEQAPGLLALDPADFLSRLQEHFGRRAGTFVAVEQRAAFPILLRVTREITAARTVLLGNAAQALHPVAGQGVNLGLRDARQLAEVLALHHGADPGSAAVLAAYRQMRRVDRRASVFLTDSLARGFADDVPVLRLARGMGLAALDNLPAAKRFFLRHLIYGAPL